VTPPRIERRLAAILAADVAGYSQLMGLDEVGTLTALKAHRRERIDPAIARHNGRIVTTAGDGLMVEFASVVDAVAGAVAIQRAMQAHNVDIPEERRIVLRIGINVGDIIIDGGDIFGDGVNVAARLEALCEPGGVCISRSANDQVRDRLALNFVDLGEQAVKNIARSVGVYGLSARDIAALPEDALPQPIPADQLAAPKRRRPAAVVGIVVLVALVGGGGWYAWDVRSKPPAAVVASPAPRPQVQRAAPDRRGSLIVLPFDIAGGHGTGIEDLARDIGERVSTERGWPVIPAVTAARYQGRAPDFRAIGREQDVHFALEGMAREQDGRLVVSAALHDTRDDRVVWSQKFEAEPVPGAAVGVAASIAAALHQAMIDTEVARARHDRAGSMDAADYYLAALESPLIPLNRTNTLARVALLDQSLAADAEYWPALALVSRLRAIVVLNDWSTDREADIAMAARTVDKLLEGRPRDVYLLRTKAYVLRAQGNMEQALAVNRRVIEIAPQLADSHREIGVILQGQGKFAEALASFRTARQLVDGDAVLDGQTAAALLATGQFGDAVVLARTALRESPGGVADTPWLTLIAAEAHAGQDGQARADLTAYLGANPATRSLAELRKSPYLASIPNLLDGLRRAGMAED